MASKYIQKYPIPGEFPELLHDFAKEVLRDQPENIYEYGAAYFKAVEEVSKLSLPFKLILNEVLFCNGCLILGAIFDLNWSDLLICWCEFRAQSSSMKRREPRFLLPKSANHLRVTIKKCLRVFSPSLSNKNKLTPQTSTRPKVTSKT